MAKYGKPLEAGHGPAPAYASVYLLKDAIEKANSLDPDAIVDALQGHRRVQGVMGRIKFTKGNQVIYGMDPQKEALGCFFQWSDDRQAGHRLSPDPSPKAQDQAANLDEVGQVVTLVIA